MEIESSIKKWYHCKDGVLSEGQMMGNSIKNCFNFSVCFLLLQGFSSCNASGKQIDIGEHTHQHTLNKDIEQLSLKQRNSDTSEDSFMKSDQIPNHSIAQVIFKRACELIPDLENPERIKPNIKDRFTWEYSLKFKKYDHVKTLNKYFIEAINGDNESKELLALWLLKGNVLKDLKRDFYERYGDNPSESQSLLKTHIELLLNEYRNDPDPELDIDADVLLEDLDYYVKKW